MSQSHNNYKWLHAIHHSTICVLKTLNYFYCSLRTTGLPQYNGVNNYVIVPEITSYYS